MYPLIVLKILGILLGVIVGIIGILMVLPVHVKVFTDPQGTVKVHYKILWFVFGKKPDPKHILVKIAVKVLGLEQYSDWDKIRMAAKVNHWHTVLHRLLSLIRRILERVVRLLNRCRVSLLHAHVTVGHEDAAMAAIEYGSISTAVYAIAGFADANMKMDKDAMDVEVSCNFAQSNPTATLDIRLSVRIFWCACALVRLIAENYRAGVYRKKPNKRS